MNSVTVPEPVKSSLIGENEDGQDNIYSKDTGEVFPANVQSQRPLNLPRVTASTYNRKDFDERLCSTMIFQLTE